MDFIDLLVDPQTYDRLEKDGDYLSSAQGEKFLCRDGTVFFLDDKAIEQWEFRHERGNTYKNLFKKYLWFLRPPHMAIYMENLKTSMGEEPSFFRFLDRLGSEAKQFVLNIGSLSKRLDAYEHVRILNLDISYYPNTDIVANAEDLPFADDSLDAIIIKNVFEHLQKPIRVRDEMLRVLKPGWYAYVKIPFMQPFHAVPDDFQRYTLEGMKELFVDFTIVEEWISVGPASAVSWILMEFLSMLFSFNNEKLYAFNMKFWRYALFWVKYLDVFFRKNKFSYKLASAYYMTIRKD